MNEDDLQELRRRRLALWLADSGGLAKVGRDRRLKPSYQSYLSQVVHGGSFGSRAARTCEDKLGMPSLWLDASAHNAPEAPMSTVLLARDSAGNFSSPDLLDDWPHVGLTKRQWEGLTADERIQLDAALMAAYAQVLKSRRLELETTSALAKTNQASRRNAA